MIDSRFYVYVYLDPRKPGQFKYESCEFDYEPIYVGKGTGERKYSHLKSAKNPKKELFVHRKIRKILETEQEPIIITFRDKLEEDKAYDLEYQLVNEIGRVNTQTGPLTNLTDGGYGIKNLVFTEEHKKNISKGRLGIEFSKEHKANISKCQLGKILSDKHKANISKGVKEKAKNEKWGWFSEEFNKTKCSPVIQMTKEGKFIKEWNSMKEAAEELNLTYNHISGCCRGKRKWHGGFGWKYKEN